MHNHTNSLEMPGLLKNAHLLCCASPIVIATYHKIRLIPLGSRALHLNIFKQPLNMGFFNNPTVPFFILIKSNLLYLLLEPESSHNTAHGE
jgi:hypothetical protein